MRISRRWPEAKFAAVFCAAFAIFMTNTEPWAQSNTISATSVPPGTFVPNATGRPTILNKDFTYPDFELWDAAKWAKSKTLNLSQWIETHQKPSPADYVMNAKYRGIKDFVGNPDYIWKTDSIRDSAVTDALEHVGLRTYMLESGSGGLYVVVKPEKLITGQRHNVPFIIVPYVLEKMDVFWAMNTLEHFKKYNELCAQRGDFMFVYKVVDKSESGGRMNLGALVDKIYDIYGGDPKRVYFDTSVFQETGAKVADVPGLDWSDDNGRKQDPDAAIEHIGFIPVLNVAGKWAVKPAYGPGIMKPRTDVPFDPARIEHGMLGQHWMEGIGFLYNHGKDTDPAVKAHFEEMGLVGGERYYKGERYLLYSPKQAVEQGTKLPLVWLYLEVYPYNEYAISDTYAEFLDYFKLAAAGELNILVYVGETPETTDIAYNLIKELEKTSPVDPSRIYVTGHSHNGHLAREFAYQHPDMIAAVATLGNTGGLAAPAYSHEVVIADDTRIEAWSKIDMPIINIGADSEVMSPHTMPSNWINNYDYYIEAWQRRLRASRCPPKTREDIVAAEHSKDYVTRLYGLPNDASSLQVIDGVEHYIIDVKNIEGRSHLRIVGIQNMVHTTEPTIPMVSWTWMRRFARDQNTGKIIELYE
jgi:hypothetical protein